MAGRSIARTNGARPSGPAKRSRAPKSDGGAQGAAWRTIRCKFAEPCPRCGERLTVGASVRWAPGHKAYHFADDCAGPGMTDEAAEAMGEPAPTDSELERLYVGRFDCTDAEVF